jgi:hypothetical protein
MVLVRLGRTDGSPERPEEHTGGLLQLPGRETDNGSVHERIVYRPGSTVRQDLDTRRPSDAAIHQTPLTAGKTDIPTGAYSMYIVRDKDDWDLVVNKNVSAGNKYDKKLDVVRLDMLSGQLSEPQKEFTVFFGHTEPKQCNLRIYYGKRGTWVEFKEK